MHRVVLTVNPVYNQNAPFCKIFINNKLLLDCQLTDTKTVDYNTNHNDFVEITIIRSGRNKDIVLNDKNNSISLEKLTINKVDIPTNIGTFQTHDNLYIEETQTHTNNFNLNGKYFLKIPLFTLQGETTTSIPENLDMDVAFFGASMTAWDFSKGKPPIPDGKNYVEIFKQKYKGRKIMNFAKNGLTNQEITQNIKSFFLNKNKAKILFVQLISVLGRQIKNISNNELKRYQIWQPSALDENTIDKFTGRRPKEITDFFAYLDVKPIIALQIPEYLKLIKLVEENNCKIYFTTYFQDEYLCYKNVFQENMAPYFQIDRNDSYVIKNQLHASPKQQEKFAEDLLTFCHNLL